MVLVSRIGRGFLDPNDLNNPHWKVTVAAVGLLLCFILLSIPALINVPISALITVLVCDVVLYVLFVVWAVWEILLHRKSSLCITTVVEILTSCNRPGRVQQKPGKYPHSCYSHFPGLGSILQPELASYGQQNDPATHTRPSCKLSTFSHQENHR